MSQNLKRDTLVKGSDLHVHFPVTGGLFQRVTGYVKAVNGVDIQVQEGEIVSVVGESGCGKSTLGNALLGLVPLTSGELQLRGNSIDIGVAKSWKPYRKDFQIIFQDPYSSLNPRQTILEILSEPMLAHGIIEKQGVREAVSELLSKVGMNPDHMGRYPHAFSGGQRQRIGIARALGLQPKMIVCDEIVAALDVSVQAQIIELLLKLKEEFSLSLVFISHDLSLVRSISDRIYVMYLGSVMEEAQVSSLFRQPRHPYTQALLDSIPTLNRNKRPTVLEGEVPSPTSLPKGCVFQTRCPKVQSQCAREKPGLQVVEGKKVDTTHQAACFFPITPSTDKPTLQPEK